MWTTQKHVPRWDLPAGLAGAQLGVKTPLPIHEGASRHTHTSLQRREERTLCTDQEGSEEEPEVLDIGSE